MVARSSLAILSVNVDFDVKAIAFKAVGSRRKKIARTSPRPGKRRGPA
jgi:hypothetical protein